MIILILILIAIIYFGWNLFFSVKLRLQTINFYSGGLGSGKTLTATTTAIILYKRSKISHFLLGSKPILKIPLFMLVLILLTIYIEMFPLTIFLFIFFLIFTIYILFKSKNMVKKYKVREIYSNYPIILKKSIFKKKIVYSNILTKEHILGVDRLPEKCIVVLDEASSIFPNNNKKSPEEYTYAFRWFRHWTDGSLILCDQSIGDIDITIRRRINIVYNFSGFRKILNICYWIDCNRINYMEDLITNVNDINNFKTSYLFRFFGKRRYNSRYMRLFYNPLTDKLDCWTDLLIKPN